MVDEMGGYPPELQEEDDAAMEEVNDEMEEENVKPSRAAPRNIWRPGGSMKMRRGKVLFEKKKGVADPFNFGGTFPLSWKRVSLAVIGPALKMSPRPAVLRLRVVLHVCERERGRLCGLLFKTLDEERFGDRCFFWKPSSALSPPYKSWPDRSHTASG
ncbi:unnamed protein product [Zymoseptoria tritici ST99CH_3D7]|uniref:Uncharacterized protein n=1 Tax=Zymoseptoria tritici (strain ST99CH_3D7) TaxID=1276538 RepID=A0A1X7RPY9_ZYMT9|nr:unnamed protein product [Zymoseptoria tritici ST99CH_3D7]